MKIYCIGIGGIGLSGVAQILRSKGHEVLGSDRSLSEITESLQKSGITVYADHRSEHITPDINLVIYSEAIPEENPERTEAKKLQIRCINYAQALAMISHDKKLIAIAGTHGKTTVTGMLSSILLSSGQDPSIIIGSRLDLLGGQNFRIGSNSVFLAEACEYRDNFLELEPTIVLINSLEPDHLDYFKTPERYYESFQRFAEKIPAHGTLILYESDQEHFDFSKIQATVHLLSDVQADEASFSLKVPGRHNQRNAFAAKAVADALGLNEQSILQGLENFRGTWRRFEYKGTLKGAKVYDDYGHHPTEIVATIQAAREWYPDEQLIVVFQPHQYSRTREFFDGFAAAFKTANSVWISDIYQARDTAEDIASVSAESLATAIVKHGEAASYVPMRDIPGQMMKAGDEKTVFLVMGAGNIHQIFQQLSFD